MTPNHILFCLGLTNFNETVAFPVSVASLFLYPRYTRVGKIVLGETPLSKKIIDLFCFAYHLARLRSSEDRDAVSYFNIKAAYFYAAHVERITGLEPATSTLARLRSTK